jgi:hypothetical protein
MQSRDRQPINAGFRLHANGSSLDGLSTAKPIFRSAAKRSISQSSPHPTGRGFHPASNPGGDGRCSSSQSEGALRIEGLLVRGIEADSGAFLSVDSTLIHSNGTGVAAYGSIRLSNSDVVLNSTGIVGTPTSFGTNRVADNGFDGPDPTLIGAISSAHGLK